MKRQLGLIIIIVIILISNLSSAQVLLNQKNGINYLPLAVGNKWQYFESTRSSYSGATSYFYNIKTTNITESQVFNNKTYYKFDGKWVRYDADSLVAYYYKSASEDEGIFVDFRAVTGHSYDNYMGTISTVRKSLSILGVNDIAVGFKHFNYSMSQPTWTYFYYLNSLGLAQYEQEVNSVMAYYGYTRQVLCGFFSADSAIAATNIDSSAPIISIEDITIDSLNNLHLQAIVNHKYSRETRKTPGVPFGDTGVCFVDSVYFEYIYTNGIDTIWGNKIKMDSTTEIKYNVALKLRQDLILNNYQFYYKITSKDIALTPHITKLPLTGYNCLEVNTNKYLNFYPLINGNIWVYKIEEVDNLGTMINVVGKNYVVVGNDTILANGNKYTKVLNNNYVRYERLDTLKGAVIEAFVENGVITESIKYMLAGETNKNYYVLQSGNPDSVKCYGPYYGTILNTPNVLIKHFKSIDNPFRNYKLGYNIGLLEIVYNNSLLTGLAYNLIAAKVNNKVYGDSTLVGGIEENTVSLNPNNFVLLQNYPNPFNPSTTISYSLPEDSYVKLKIFDIVGREITVLFDGEKPAGNYSVSFNPNKSGLELSSGIYFYYFEAISIISDNIFRETKKLIYLK
ncbi:MAG: hypothetical protein V1773_04915 [bacterium]